MSRKPQKAMSKKNLHEEKIELVKLRIQNKFYEKSHILEDVVEEILKTDLKKAKR
jgi:hypothetical protein